MSTESLRLGPWSKSPSSDKVEDRRNAGVLEQLDALNEENKLEAERRLREDPEWFPIIGKDWYGGGTAPFDPKQSTSLLARDLGRDQLVSFEERFEAVADENIPRPGKGDLQRSVKGNRLR